MEKKGILAISITPPSASVVLDCQFLSDQGPRKAVRNDYRFAEFFSAD